MKFIAFWENSSGLYLSGSGNDIASAFADLKNTLNEMEGISDVPFHEISFFEAYELDVRREVCYFHKRKE